MSDDLYEIWRDDCLIEAAARADLLELEDDPAAGPLLALSTLADGAPLPRLDVDGAALVDSRTSHRYAVRSLAVAVTAVATLSTSGVAAVVTGDPLRPAKAVWHQIQDHTGLRADGEGARAGSGAALGAPAGEPPGLDPSKPSAVAVAPGASRADGLTARAPVRVPGQAGDSAATSQHAQAAEDPAAEENTQPYPEDDPQSSDEQDQSEQPAEPPDSDQQEPGDDGSQPAPGEEQEPAPDDQSGDGGLEDLIPGQTQDDGTVPDGGGAVDEQVLGQGTAQDTVQNTVDGTAAGGSADESTDTGTTAPPPTTAP